MTIFKKLILMVVTAVIAICAIAGLQLRSSSLMNESLYHAQEAARNQHLLQIINSEFGYGGFIHNFKNYVLRGSQKYMDRFGVNKNILLETIEQLDALLVRQEDKEALRVIHSTALEYIDAMAACVNLHKNGKISNEIDNAVKINDGPALNAFKVINQGILKIEKQSRSEMQKGQQRMLIISVCGYIGIFLLFAGIFFIFLKMLKKLNVLVKTTKILASGDVTIRSNIQNNDEIGWVSDASNKLAQHLDFMLSKVRGSSSTIDNAITFLNTKAEKSLDSAQEMAGNCNSVAAAAEELKIGRASCRERV